MIGRWRVDPRLVMSLALVLTIGAVFWLGSRYPSLDRKAAMGDTAEIHALGFEPLIEIGEQDGPALRVLYTTVNWLHTNKQGMTFGLLFAPALMLVISLLQHRFYSGLFANTAMGMLVGIPLGVCVNCAAPIAHGMRSAGARTETMLATMTSSPTLNIVVVTMLIAMFPPYMVVLKLGLTLTFVLLFVPLLTRLFRAHEMRLSDAGPIPAAVPLSFIPPPVADTAQDRAPGWWESVKWLLREYGRTLVFILRTTVPFMILAGFLGAVLITFFPWEQAVEFFPRAVAGQVHSRTVGRLIALATLTAVTLGGAFLPVPIAFDIVICAVLLAAGMSPHIVVALLFTLGIFSVYPFFIVWQTISRRMAVGVYVSVAGLGVVGGVLAKEYSDRQARIQTALFVDVFTNSEAAERGPTRAAVSTGSTPLPDGELLPLLAADAIAREPFPVRSEQGVTVDRFPFGRRSPEGDSPFMLQNGGTLGLDVPYGLSVIYLVDPYANITSGVASGDVHNDGWADLLFGTEMGPVLFANRVGTGFERQPVGVDLPSGRILNAALVDLDGDGWLDIFFSVYRSGNYVLYNRSGSFAASVARPLPNLDGAVGTVAVAFGDLDLDGRLDVVLGNWTVGASGLSETGWRSRAPVASRNAVLHNTVADFVLAPLAGVPGETLTSLLTDLNGDHIPDLIVGNDFLVPDMIYLGGPGGTLHHVSRADALVPHTTTTTMSVTSGDIDNDLEPELFFVQVSDMPGGERRPPGQDVCADFGSGRDRRNCDSAMATYLLVKRSLRLGDAAVCLEHATLAAECVGLHMWNAAARVRLSPRLCRGFPAAWDELSFLCRHVERYEATATELAAGIPSKNRTNVLLTGDAGGRFRDVTSQLGLEYTGWTWNARFADLDNDGWQDLFAVNGNFHAAVLRNDWVESNVFFRNQGGASFEDETVRFGLESFVQSGAYSYVDFDNDGDLDIVVRSMLGPVGVYVNTSNSGNAIEFSLRDHVGNSFGIGSRIVIRYGENGELHQLREVQASGGYLSFDAPVAHFGLGESAAITSVEVQWSTGETTGIEADFAAGYRYTITRQP